MLRSSPPLGRITAAICLVALAFPLPTAVARAAPPSGSPQVPLDSHLIPQFVQALPTLDIAGGTIQTVDGTRPATIRMCEFESEMLPPGTLDRAAEADVAGGSARATGADRVATTAWGYVAGSRCPEGVRDTFTGPIVLAKRNVPTAIRWVNDLGTTRTSKLLAYTRSTDQTIFWADPANGEMNACDTKQAPAPGTPCAQNYEGVIPGVVHLHGGEVPPEVDGGPDGWFTSGGTTGPAYYSARPGEPNASLLRYPNVQEAAPLWFHDHTMGATRLAVYAGLAGAYLLADDDLRLPTGLAEYGLVDRGRLEPTIPLVVQDRSFDTNGQLYFPAGTSGGEVNSPNPQHPYWVPEFIGDTILVNGKAWPYLDVQPKRYRFLFLDGSNARSYAMSLVDPVSGNPGPSMYVIATDGGYLDRPVRVDGRAALPSRLLMMPGERYEVVLDFSGFGRGVRGPNGRPYSGRWLLQNDAPAPYPSGDPVDPTTTGRIMEFDVGGCTSGACGRADTSYEPASGRPIRTGGQRIVRLANPANGRLAGGVAPAKVRQLTLNEITADPSVAVDPATGRLTSYPGGPLEVVVNNSPYDGGSDMATSTCARSDFTSVTKDGMTLCVSETPREGDTELWELVNLTADAHPIHLHLVQFQLLNRQSLDVDAYTEAYAAAFPGGRYTPEAGPPLDYAPSARSGGTYGGNPDVRPYLVGRPEPPHADEAGWKDTVMAPPGTVTRLVVRFAPTDARVNAPAAALAFPFDPSTSRGYVWHCHILDHEDNEMMRPYEVGLNPAAPAPAARSLVLGRDY